MRKSIGGVIFSRIIIKHCPSALAKGNGCFVVVLALAKALRFGLKPNYDGSFHNPDLKDRGNETIVPIDIQTYLNSTLRRRLVKETEKKFFTTKAQSLKLRFFLKKILPGSRRDWKMALLT